MLSACSPGDQAGTISHIPVFQSYFFFRKSLTPSLLVTSTLLQSEVCKGFPVPSRSAELIRTVIIIAAVAFPAVGLRFVARYMVVSSWWWDDWSILLAAVSVHSFLLLFMDVLSECQHIC